jgi:predicted AlkP superfamily phosphohydrolase/phosphomutase
LKEEIKSKVGGGGGGGAPDLEQELNHITAVLDTTEKLHQKLQPKTVESFEEWQKKHTIISEEEKEKRAHEEKIKELEAKKTKHETVAALINAAMMQALNAVNQKREKRTQEQAVAEEKEKALLSELKAEFEQQPEEKEEGK